MKKLILIYAASIALAFTANAQMVTKQDIDNFDMSQYDRDGDGKVKEDEIVLAVKDLYSLDENGGITHTEIVENIAKNKEQIYVAINDCFTRFFNGKDSAIQFNDKEAGTIIGKLTIGNLGSASNIWTGSSSSISSDLIIRVDIKDGRMRITASVPSYDLRKSGGLMNIKTAKSYLPAQVYPFTDKEKKVAGRAFVNAHIWTTTAINKIKDAVVNELPGANEDW